MINVIIPIIQNAKSYRKIIAELSAHEDIDIFIGIVSGQKGYLEFPNTENVHVIEYNNEARREEIINSMQKYIQGGDLFIMRKPIAYNEFLNFVRNGADIVVCKKDYTPLKRFFFNIWQRILKIFLGIKLYEGDTSAIYFEENLVSVLSQGNNLSYSSRVDRWRGVSQDSVVVQGGPVKTEVDKKENIRYILFGILALVIGIAVTTLVAIFARVSIVIGLFLFCLDAICLAIFLLLLLVVVFNSIVGKKKFSSATEIDFVAGFDNIGSEQLEDGEERMIELEEDDDEEN